MTTGTGLHSRRHLADSHIFEASFDVLVETAQSFVRWKELVLRNQVAGKQVHDACLVAVMVDYGIRRILTYNTRHFLRFADIETLHPDDILDHGNDAH